MIHLCEIEEDSETDMWFEVVDAGPDPISAAWTLARACRAENWLPETGDSYTIKVRPLPNQVFANPGLQIGAVLRWDPNCPAVRFTLTLSADGSIEVQAIA